MLLKGKETAEKINGEIKERVNRLKEKGTEPALAIVRVGENPGDIAYERGAVKKAEALGIKPVKYTCPEDCTEEKLIKVIEDINGDRGIHGILLLQPLPKHMNSERVRNTIAAEKDVDCITDRSLGNLFIGKEGFAPCTAESCMEILKHYDIPVMGKKAVVIGRSLVIGKPAAIMLMKDHATVTVCHTKTAEKDRRAFCRNADIIISAAGKINALTTEDVKEGQTVIDVGINFDENGKMKGDADFDSISTVVKNITPVPGGVGSVTTTVLMRHLVEAAEKSSL